MLLGSLLGAFKASLMLPIIRQSEFDGIGKQISEAKQMHEVAVSKVNQAFCENLDGPGCETARIQITK